MFNWHTKIPRIRILLNLGLQNSFIIENNENMIEKSSECQKLEEIKKQEIRKATNVDGTISSLSRRNLLCAKSQIVQGDEKTVPND